MKRDHSVTQNGVITSFGACFIKKLYIASYDIGWFIV